MNDLPAVLLDRYFWPFVDQGTAWESTPLFIGTFEGESLAIIIFRDFGISHSETETALEFARREVAL